MGSNSVIGYSNRWNVFKKIVPMNSWWNGNWCWIRNKFTIIFVLCFNDRNWNAMVFLFSINLWTMDKCVWYVFYNYIKNGFTLSIIIITNHNNKKHYYNFTHKTQNRNRNKFMKKKAKQKSHSKKSVYFRPINEADTYSVFCT